LTRRPRPRSSQPAGVAPRRLGPQSTAPPDPRARPNDGLFGRPLDSPAR
jgi:hypothetical protein